MSSSSFKIFNNERFFEIMNLIYMYKKDFALNDLEWLIC